MNGFHPSELIEEIKKRPGIYNKDELEQPRREQKYRLWMEVAERLTPMEDWQIYTTEEKEARVDEIQLKWKHMRDHFHREIKLHSLGKDRKKRKYVYFDAMEFMRPFVGAKLHNRNGIILQDSSGSVGDGDGDGRDDEIDDVELEESQCINGLTQEDDDIVLEQHLEDNNNDEIVETVETITAQHQIYPTDETINEPTCKRTKQEIFCSDLSLSKSSSSSSSSTSNRDRNQKKVRRSNSSINERSIKSNAYQNANNTRVTTINETSQNVQNSQNAFKIRDADISFALSLVPSLRKLSEAAKLEAKIEILKVLYKYVKVKRKPSKNFPQNKEEHEYIQDNDDDNNFKNEQSMIYSENSCEEGDPLHNTDCTDGNTKPWWT